MANEENCSEYFQKYSCAAANNIYSLGGGDIENI